MSRFVKPAFVSLLGILVLVAAGCGSSEVAQDSTDRSPTEPTVAAKSSEETAPTDVVSQFLDRVRRGGTDSGAGELLTLRAQQELKRIGQEIQPLGTPDARFDVTRSVDVPGEDNAAWVHSIWAEPETNGQVSSTQVVWKMRREAAGWRICGMALEVDPDTAPLEIDFEDGDQLANTLFATQQENTAPTNAANSNAANSFPATSQAPGNYQAPAIATEPSQGMQPPNF